nr:MAG TPA: hypothetical protein [Caudoviricetes sp.]
MVTPSSIRAAGVKQRARICSSSMREKYKMFLQCFSTI